MKKSVKLTSDLIKELVLKLTREKFYDLGFSFTDNEYQEKGALSYIKSENNFTYGFSLMFNLNTIQAKIISPVCGKSDMFLVVERIPRKWFSYKSVADLEEIIINLTNYFFEKGTKWLSEHHVQEVDLLRFYKQKMDPLLNSFDFQRTRTDLEILYGGSVVYTSGPFSIVFKHLSGETFIKPIVKKEDQELALIQWIMDNRSKYIFNLQGLTFYYYDEETLNVYFSKISELLKLFISSREYDETHPWKEK